LDGRSTDAQAVSSNEAGPAARVRGSQRRAAGPSSPPRAGGWI